jgi:hypothetical protein
VVGTALLAKGERAGATTLPTPVSGVAVEACGAARAVIRCEADEEGPGSSRGKTGLDAWLHCCGDAGMVQGLVDVERI